MKSLKMYIFLLYIYSRWEWQHGVGPLEHWERGFESRLGHGSICLCFSVFCCPV